MSPDASEFKPFPVPGTVTAIAVAALAPASKQRRVVFNPVQVLLTLENYLQHAPAAAQSAAVVHFPPAVIVPAILDCFCYCGRAYGLRFEDLI